MSPENFTIWLNGFIAMRNGLIDDELDYLRSTLEDVTIERDEAIDSAREVMASLGAMTSEEWDWLNNRIPYNPEGYRWRKILSGLKELTKIDDVV